MRTAIVTEQYMEKQEQKWIKTWGDYIFNRCDNHRKPWHKSKQKKRAGVISFGIVVVGEGKWKALSFPER